MTFKCSRIEPLGCSKTHATPLQLASQINMTHLAAIKLPKSVAFPGLPSGAARVLPVDPRDLGRKHAKCSGAFQWPIFKFGPLSLVTRVDRARVQT